jgi:hypothetical protein
MTMAAEAARQGGAFHGADPTWRLPAPLRRVLLLVPPLLLAGLEIIHPQPEANAQAVMDVSTWFAGFHVIQLVLIGAVALSVLLLADSFGRANAFLAVSGVSCTVAVRAWLRLCATRCSRAPIGSWWVA